MITKPQLHVSDMERIGQCPVLWQRTRGYLFGCWHEQELAPPSTQLAIGSAVHKSVETNLRHKTETEQLIEREQAQQAARDEFQVIWDGGMLLSNDEAVNIKKTHGASVDQAVQLSELHYDDLAPKLTPVEIEKKFVLLMPENSPVDLSGQIDVIEQVDGGHRVIRDTKTKSSSPPENILDSNIQMGMYAMAEKVHTKRLPAEVHLDFLVKTKMPKLVTRSAVPDDTWLAPVKARIARTIKLIELGRAGNVDCFTFADPSHWICSKRYCPLAKMDRCEFIRRQDRKE